jgi:hypothetical protein
MIERPPRSNVEASAQETHSKEVRVGALLVAGGYQSQQFVKQFVVTFSRRAFQGGETLPGGLTNLNGRARQPIQCTKLTYRFLSGLPMVALGADRGGDPFLKPGRCIYCHRQLRGGRKYLATTRGRVSGRSAPSMRLRFTEVGRKSEHLSEHWSPDALASSSRGERQESQGTGRRPRRLPG